MFPSLQRCGVMLGLVVSLLATASSSAQVVISEFMAANTNTNIRDEDGSSADWLELHNTGAESVSLNGWYLTDTSGNLRKWQFPQTTPAVTLAPGARLLVWASNKNRKVAANRLHTNFSLNNSGEYLALVRPDGFTVEHDFAPTFPPQAADVSYGVSGGRQWNVLVGPTLNSAWKVKSPREAAEVVTGWNADASAAFDSSSWATKTTTVSGGVPRGIGYDAGGSGGAQAVLINYAGSAGVVSSAAELGITSGMFNNNGTGPNFFNGTPTLCMRATFTVANRTQVQGMRLNIRFDDGFILYLNGTAILTQNAPAPVAWNAAAPTDRVDDTIVTFDLTESLAALLNGNNVLAIHGFNDAKNSPHFVITPDFQTQTVSTGAWSTVVGPSLSSQWRVKSPFSANEFTRMNGWTTAAFNDLAWVAKGTRVNGANIQGIGYDSFGAGGPRGVQINYSPLSLLPNGVVATASDVGLTGMYNAPATGTDAFPGTPTLLARATFNVADPATTSQLRMNIRYDDGFVAYLNGTEIARANAPATPQWNSTATDREDDLSEEYQTFVLSNAHLNLVAGTNLLAIHGFNEAKNSGHFVITPSFEAFQESAAGGSGATGYLATPTPGAENTVATAAIGPDLSSIVENPPQPVGGVGSAPLLVTARVRPTLGTIAGASVRYIINFAGETLVPMRDDGTSGDVTPNDGVFSAELPTAGLAPGHLLRWRIVATDAAGNQTTAPTFRDPYDNDQYFGTMAQTPAIQSRLPVLYWFHNSGATTVFATNESGFRSSFFYQLPGEVSGRYYDNVRVNLHGQSSAGFPKKSQNVNFNADNRFKWRQGEKEIRGMNLLSNWADKAHVRNALAWETFNLTRHPSHWCEIVRLQQVTAGNVNAGVDNQFLGILDMVEDGNEEFLERWDLDPNGSLYKVYNSLENTLQNSATQGAGVEKKTREFEDFSDLQALIDAMNPGLTTSARRQWLYDNVDVPALINYLAVHNLIFSHDYGHKNYYVYRDTLGTGEWKLLPWDQDLSFGHRWTNAQNYFDDDLESASSIFFGGGGNRLMNIVLASGATELAQAYVRRLRTLMDEFYGPPSAPVNFFVDRTNHYLDLMEPPNWPAMTDAERDFRKWGFWVDGNGGAIPWTDARAVHHRIRPTAIRITEANSTVATGGPYPGANPYLPYGSTPNLHSSLQPFLPGRRAYLYGQIPGAIPNVNGQAIPGAQPATLAASLVIEQVNFNPGGTSQAQEYFVIRNPNPIAVDISHWTLAGAIAHTFPPGTVLPAQSTSTSDGASSVYVNQLIVAKDPRQFRLRTVSPKRSEYRLVIGGYDGQLSARGETIELRDATGTLHAINAYLGSPTIAQQILRITELNYAPTAPTAAETGALPGVQAGDFEFIELLNTGASALSLGGAMFEEGVVFNFPPAFTLAAGARTLLVANQAAFALRYGSGFQIAGQYEGRLENSGDKLQLLDPSGEVILSFTYDPAWFPPTANGGGYSLVTRTSAPAHNTYEQPAMWAISGQAGGSPGVADAAFAEVFEGWRHDYFNADDLLDPAIGGLLADPEGDGTSNFGEYAFGGNPRLGDNPAKGVASMIEAGGAQYLAVTFLRRTNALDVSYVVEATSDLANPESWSAVNLPAIAAENLGGGLERVTYRDSQPLGGAPRFLRVRASR